MNSSQYCRSKKTMNRFNFSAWGRAWLTLRSKIDISFQAIREQIFNSELRITRDEPVFTVSALQPYDISKLWHEAIAQWLDDPAQAAKKRFTSAEILTGAINMDIDKTDSQRSAVTRLGIIMVGMGWKKARKTSGGYRSYYYGVCQGSWNMSHAASNSLC